jgi:membrane-associated phospholipid phosphatase
MSANILEYGGAEGALPAERFVAWPGARHLLYAAALALANGLWFMAVFAACDAFTAARALRVPIHFAAELRIPFVPEASAAYMSMYLLFAAGPFILRTRAQFRAAIATLATIIAIAGACFLLVPATLAYPPVGEDALGSWAGLYHVADDLNLTYNLFPSLHVALSVACVAAFGTRVAGVGRMLLWAWALAIALSTLLLHQHHVLDVLGGWLLATLCFGHVYQRSSGR